MKNNVFCTIFTPAYNRGSLLINLYASLCNQKNFDFEWLIVDDGSIDDTENVVKTFTNKKFKIRYFKKENGGKHTAINLGLDKAKGKIFAIVDSDDLLDENATKIIYEKYNELEKENQKIKYAGIAFQKGYLNKKSVGKTFNKEYVDAKSTERKKYNITGDKFETFYLNILKKYKFPVISGEKFMTEAIVWNRISRDNYYLRWYSDIIYYCEYLPNGLTDSRDNTIKNSPIGYSLYIKELVKYGNISFKEKLGYYSYYAKIRRKSKISFRKISLELNTSIIVIYISIIIRNFIYFLRGMYEKIKKRI